jgi:hypothetical protein
VLTPDGALKPFIKPKLKYMLGVGVILGFSFISFQSRCFVGVCITPGFTPTLRYGFSVKISITRTPTLTQRLFKTPEMKSVLVLV